MNVENWELKDNCDEVQWYYESKLNDEIQKLYKIMQTCIKFDSSL